MKVLLVVLVMIGLGYYVITYHSPFQTEESEPYFVEIRFEAPVRSNKLQMVGVGKMYSLEDCQVRSALTWNNLLDQIGRVSVDTECKKEVSKKYLRLFDNRQTTATYIAFDKGEEGERDARFLIYGAPSSMAYEACKLFVEKAKNEMSYAGEIYCIKGSVG
jgi:hypothetical protein